MLKLSQLRIFTRISYKGRLQRPPKIRRICMRISFPPFLCDLFHIHLLSQKNSSWHPVTLEWFSIQILVNFDIFELSWRLPLRIWDRLLWIKGRFEPHNASGNILRQFKNFQISKGLYEKPLKRDWVARVVGGRCDRYFWDIRPEIDRLPNLNMLFQFLLTILEKAKCLRAYRKWSRDHLMQKAY